MSAAARVSRRPSRWVRIRAAVDDVKNHMIGLITAKTAGRNASTVQGVILTKTTFSEWKHSRLETSRGCLSFCKCSLWALYHMDTGDKPKGLSKLPVWCTCRVLPTSFPDRFFPASRFHLQSCESAFLFMAPQSTQVRRVHRLRTSAPPHIHTSLHIHMKAAFKRTLRRRGRARPRVLHLAATWSTLTFPRRDRRTADDPSGSGD